MSETRCECTNYISAADAAIGIMQCADCQAIESLKQSQEYPHDLPSAPVVDLVCGRCKTWMIDDSDVYSDCAAHPDYQSA